MKNKFEHEIRITKDFLTSLESFLGKESYQMLEESREQFYIYKQQSTEKIKILEEELAEKRLKVSQMAMEKGELLKKIDNLTEFYVPDVGQQADATGRP